MAFTITRGSNYLQMMMGLYLYSGGSPRKSIDILHGAGLSVSYPTVNRLLENLTEDAVKRVQLAASLEPWLLVYDNINFSQRKYDQRIGNADDFESGTTATIIIGKHLGSVHQVRDTYPRLCLPDLMIDEAQMLHFNNVCRFHLVQELRKNLDGYTRCSTPTLELRLLPVKKTRTYPLPIMKIDQSTVEGNKAIVETTIEQTLGLDKAWFDDGKKLVVAGDQLTVTRLRSLKELRDDESSPYKRLDWIVP
ncbi:hypothetical protein EDD11_000562, partial [Mortierella claussenii]